MVGWVVGDEQMDDGWVDGQVVGQPAGSGYIGHDP